MKKLIVALLLAGSAFTASAETTQEKETLNYLLVEIAELNKLVDDAERFGRENTSNVRFDYQSLRNDLILIQRGLSDYVNERHHMPRTVEPLQGDYRR